MVRNLTSARLERAYETYVAPARAGDYGLDPVALPHAYRDPDDVAVVAFVASTFAYGSRKVFVPTIRRQLRKLGKHPASALTDASAAATREFTRDFAYRFHGPDDLLGIYAFLRDAHTTHGSLRALFRASYDADHDDPLVRMLRKTVKVYEATDLRPYGIRRLVGDTAPARFLFPDPQRGSACKRACLFLRWLCRRDAPDFGLWRFVHPRHLIVPLDVHLARIARRYALTSRKSNDLTTAREITASLARFDPRDPTRFDYALYLFGADTASRG